MSIVDRRLSCRSRGVRLTGVLCLAASLPLHPITSLLDAPNFPAALEYLEFSKDSFGWKVIEPANSQPNRICEVDGGAGGH